MTIATAPRPTATPNERAARYRAAAARADRAAITARTPANSRELRERARDLRLQALLTALEIPT